MQWYPWLNPYYKQIIQQHQVDKAHHACLIQALPGMGADALVWGLARWLMCVSPEGMKSCGHCHGCQLMAANNHPDWTPIQVEKGKNSIGIDAIRQASDKLYYFAQQGGAKVVWIDHAELLTEAAANALLKTLEEPPEKCWFFITTTQPSALPATLRSRCLPLHLSPPAEGLSDQWLAKQNTASPLQRQTALRLSGGSPGAALALLETQVWQQRSKLCESVHSALPYQPLQLLSLLNQDNVVQQLDWLITLLIDALKVSQGAGQWLTNADQRELIDFLSHQYIASSLNTHIQRWLACRHELHSAPQVNRELVLTEALLAWETPSLPH